MRTLDLDFKYHLFNIHRFTESEPMPGYEYVSEREYKPMKAELTDIIRRARKHVVEEDPELDFEYRLIGSGGKNLITREIGGNRGYDFDYNLVIDAPEQGMKWVGKEVHRVFLNAFRQTVAGTPFKEPEESTSVLTIKKVDRRRKAVACSCDFAIVYYDPSGHHFLQYNKGNGGFGFQHRSFRYDVDGLAEEIRHADNGWNELRDEYLRLKNADTQSKRSFVLYVEAVNNVHRRLLGSRPTPLDAYISLSLGGIGVYEPFRYSDSPVRGIYDIGSGRLLRRAES